MRVKFFKGPQRDYLVIAIWNFLMLRPDPELPEKEGDHEIIVFLITHTYEGRDKTEDLSSTVRLPEPKNLRSK